MAGLLRLLMICLLALALPMQGVAAATRAFCGTDHRHPQLQAMAGATAAHRHDAMSSSADPVHHATAAQVEAADDLRAPDGATPAASPSQTGKHKCSACAACCSVGAVPDTDLTVPAAELTRTVFAAVPSAIAAVAADGPERPPRRRAA